MDAHDEWLIALDIDGTVLLEDGTITDAVTREVRRVRDLGHHVMMATGRSASMTLPVMERLGLTSEYVVSSNGSITLKRDANAPAGYSRVHVETFDPTSVLRTIADNLHGASFAVEDETGLYRYTGHFAEGTLGASAQKVELEELSEQSATRLVVISPQHQVEDFLHIVEGLGLRKVSYNIGWTAWLDIAPEGVNKATALERVRGWLDIPRSRVMAVGDGRNDIEMLAWAGEHGRSVAMGQAPPEVLDVASERTGTDLNDGVATLFAAL